MEKDIGVGVYHGDRGIANGGLQASGIGAENGHIGACKGGEGEGLIEFIVYFLTDVCCVIPPFMIQSSCFSSSWGSCHRRPNSTTKSSKSARYCGSAGARAVMTISCSLAHLAALPAHNPSTNRISVSTSGNCWIAI